MNEKIATPNAPQAIGPYSQAIRLGDFLFVSGQIAIDPQTANIIEGDIDNVDQMAEFCKKGPEHSLIREVKEKEERFQDFKDFKVLKF